ncbi:MAG: acyltransferase [Clostridiales bacterium]|nr:acyltransferase [Clostridiales bacterium]
MTTKRTEWIDCLKFFAILSVVIHHGYGGFYHKWWIVFLTQFSVPVFVFLGGANMYQSQERSISVSYCKDVFRRLKALFVPYLIVTAAIVFFQVRQVHLIKIWDYAIHFSGSAQFYFILFYAQLILISRVLYAIIYACKTSKNNILCYIVSILFMSFVCAFLYRHSFVLEVHGGGKFLFGASFLLLYFVGMIFGAYYKDVKWNKWVALIVFCCSIIATFFYAYYLYKKGFTIDNTIIKVFGNGNPPGLNSMFFAFLVCLVGWSANEFIDGFSLAFAFKFRTGFAILGRHTLYVFLMHCFVYAFFFNSKYGRVLGDNIWIRRCFYIPAEIFLPIMFEVYVRHFFSFFQSLVDNAKQLTAKNPLGKKLLKLAIGTGALLLLLFILYK